MKSSTQEQRLECTGNSHSRWKKIKKKKKVLFVEAILKLYCDVFNC